MRYLFLLTFDIRQIFDRLCFFAFISRYNLSYKLDVNIIIKYFFILYYKYDCFTPHGNTFIGT